MQPSHQNRWLALVYAATIFTSAFLLFQIQPMVSKAILPWFGGTPAVWTICLLFFQSLLFAGYAYAHFSNNWLGPRQQALLHIVMIGLAFLLLRVLPDASWQPHGEAEPTRQILLMLVMTIGLPYFVLSATGPLLQAWFARSFPGRTPYRLYALSNVGSLLALISYPFLFERLFELPWQARMWQVGFLAFGLLCAYAAWRARATTTDPLPAPNSELPIPPSELPADSLATPRPHVYLLWLLLPAFASATLLATTNHVETDVAVVPLLWIVPLALYLLTFIVAFDRPAWYHRTSAAVVTLIALYVTAFCSKNGLGYTKINDICITCPTLQTIADFLQIPTKTESGTLAGPKVYISFLTALGANFLAMFGVCFLCHGELARLKPSTRHLTAYYLMMSAGGALGGLAVSIVAPHVFKTVFEWKAVTFIAAIGAIGLILYALVGRAVGSDDEPGEVSDSTIWSRVLLVALLAPTSFILLDLVEYLHRSQRNVVYQSRNFFGTLTIREVDADKPAAANRVLLNGTTIHGSQFTSPERRGQPTSYYATTSGVGRVLNFFHNPEHKPPGGLRIGDVGLGTGTLAAYAMKGDFLTFFEINPTVIDMATSGEWFTYIADCRARGAKCDVKPGDARLTIENELRDPKLPRYHVLVLDAFSGDAVPTHLLTAEAYDIWLPRLATEAVDGAEGALIVHVSNRYLDLSRVVRAAAERFNLGVIEVHSPGVNDELINSADWMILTRNKELLAELAKVDFKSDKPPKPPVLWTDARSNLFEIIK